LITAGVDLAPIILLSLAVSVSATFLAAIIGVPLAALLTLADFRGRKLAVIAVNALLGLPPVVVGLALYLLLSRSGPLGALGLLFTPEAMVLAQAILAIPIIAALAHRVLERNWAEFQGPLRVFGATRLQALPILLAMSQRSIATAVLAGFGRTVSEVGAVLIVGGNIAGHTRSMTTSIALQTSMGNLEVAMLLGFILIGISLSVSAAVIVFGGNRP
jgi:tungstate transport system permease protein